MTWYNLADVDNLTRFARMEDSYRGNATEYKDICLQATTPWYVCTKVALQLTMSLDRTGVKHSPGRVSNTFVPGLTSIDH